MTVTTTREVGAISTDDFKKQFRAYLLGLQDMKDHPYRAALLDCLFGAFDVWEANRQQFWADTPRPFIYPFMVSMKGGREFGHYSQVNAFGAPSTIHIRRDVLLRERDGIRLQSIAPNPCCNEQRQLVLNAKSGSAAGHALFLEQLVLHEGIHQFLHEAASPEVSETYALTESGENGYKGHGSLFASECNRIGALRQAAFGLEFVPVRHSKKTHAGSLKQRPSCSQWGWVDLFFAWDPSAKNLTAEQAEENERRMGQALGLFEGAIEVVTVEETVPTAFNCPFADAAAVAIDALLGFDMEQGTNTLETFLQTVLDRADELKGVITSIKAQQQDDADDSDADADIEDDSPVVDVPTVRDIDDTLTAEEKTEVIAEVPSQPFPKLSVSFPKSNAADSLQRLTDLVEAEPGGAAALGKRLWGHADGSSISRHLKALRQLAEAQG